MWLRTRLSQFVADVRTSYWFVTALLALAGFAAGLGMVWFDAVIGDAWLGRFEWFYGSRPQGARALLSTVAGSTITVAGVVFSVTLAAVTYASGQYGPRLLSTFTSDRGNQVSLGVFIGTFLYCLVVLRTIRSAEETSAVTAGAIREAFVPHTAMFGALTLAVASIAVLIYFVHHVTDSIHINNVIARIGKGLLDDIARQRDGSDPTTDCANDDLPLVDGRAVLSAETGYIEALDEQALLTLAAERDWRVEVLVIPGDFVHQRRPLLCINAAEADDTDSGRDVFSFGRKRSALQDLRFPIDELVEIAARALSSGVNDPFTAVACIDWLGAALIELGTMPTKPSTLYDQGGTARVRVPRLSMANYLDGAVGQLAPYAVKDPNVGARLITMLAKVADALPAGPVRVLVETEHARITSMIQQARGQ